MLVEADAARRGQLAAAMLPGPMVQLISPCASGEQACGEYLSSSPRVVVCAVELPGISGVETLYRLRRRDSRAAVIMLGADDDALRRDRCLQTGARGYLRESHALRDIAEAVRCVADGSNFLDDETAQQLALNGPNQAAAQLEALSIREFEVFYLLAQGQALSTIAKRLSLGYKTVAGYGTRVRHKLAVSSSAELSQLANRLGVLAVRR